MQKRKGLTMVKVGDVVTLRGKNGNQGKVKEIKTDKAGRIRSYVIDRGYRVSEIYAGNILEHTRFSNINKGDIK